MRARRNPPPRPALRRAGDGSVLPVAAHLALVAGDLPYRDGEGSDPLVPAVPAPARTLELRLPGELAADLAAKATAYGYTAEEAVYHLVRDWVER